MSRPNGSRSKRLSGDYSRVGDPLANPPMTPTTPVSGGDTSNISSSGERDGRRSSTSTPPPPPTAMSEVPIVSPSPRPTSSLSNSHKRPISNRYAGPPPSAFAFSPYQFPFQSHPGNPDPGTHIPRIPLSNSRRSSFDSLPPAPDDRDLAPPKASFMEQRETSGYSSDGSTGSVTPPLRTTSPSQNVYRDSVAGNLTNPNAGPSLTRRHSATNFRPAFLAPSSRPQSACGNRTSWQPPSFGNTPDASTTHIALPTLTKRAPAPTTRIPAKLEKTDKPWLDTANKNFDRKRTSWWITFACFFLGVAISGFIIFQGMSTVELIPQSKLCVVLDDDFSQGIDNNTWNYDVELGGFGNGEFQMTTRSGANVYTKNSQLYIWPQLTSDTLSSATLLFNGGNITLPDCTSTNKTACSVTSNRNTSSVLNPVISGRLNTKAKASIAFGKVEVRAKLPRGDWLWPAIWMLPEDDSHYGGWPIGGEIDIMESKGNLPSYQDEGSNYVRSSLNYGPLNSLVRSLTASLSNKHTSFASGFHTYAMEWDHKFMRLYVDSRLTAMLELQVGKGWWERAGFPDTASNGTYGAAGQGEVVVTNPYAAVNGTINAPYDQPFYLIIDLAVGGTSGWFKDDVGNKPWVDGSLTAMTDFARKQPTWSATWPADPDDRAFRIDYVKMWKMC